MVVTLDSYRDITHLMTPGSFAQNFLTLSLILYMPSETYMIMKPVSPPSVIHWNGFDVQNNRG